MKIRIARINTIAALAFAAAIVSGCGGSTASVNNGAPARGFQIVTPEIAILPGQEITYCYYFRTPNTETMAVKKWTSLMTPGSHHMIMFTTSTEILPVGTVSASQCGISGANAQIIPAWQYAAQTPTAELALPVDDGTGKPLGQEIAANTPGFIQMHYVNTTNTEIKAQVTLNAEAHDAGVTYTKTASYFTYNGNLNIPDGSVDLPQSQTCATPAGAMFWRLSTHAHKQAIKTSVINGMATSTDVAFTSTDWEHPGATVFTAAPFYTFTGDKLTYECRYTNHTGRTIITGDSAVTDELCMAIGYYFPASKARICYDNFLLP